MRKDAKRVGKCERNGKTAGNCERMWEREVVDGKEGIRAEVAGEGKRGRDGTAGG